LFFFLTIITFCLLFPFPFLVLLSFFPSFLRSRVPPDDQPKLRHVTHNVPPHSAFADLDGGTRQLLGALVASDLELYVHGLARFERDVAAASRNLTARAAVATVATAASASGSESDSGDGTGGVGRIGEEAKQEQEKEQEQERGREEGHEVHPEEPLGCLSSIEAVWKRTTDFLCLSETRRRHASLEGVLAKYGRSCDSSSSSSSSSNSSSSGGASS
jgi:hypothetical protein